MFPQCGLYLLYINTQYISSGLVKVKGSGVWLQRGELLRAFLLGFVYFLLHENTAVITVLCLKYEIEDFRKAGILTS